MGDNRELSATNSVRPPLLLLGSASWLSPSRSSNHETDRDMMLLPQQDGLICPKEWTGDGKSRDKKTVGLLFVFLNRFVL